jgi:DNA-binding transcriptional regulator YiaG
MKFSTELKNWQTKLNCNQKEFSCILYNIPNRTLQSWLLGEKQPPVYVQKLIIHKLENNEKISIKTIV